MVGHLHVVDTGVIVEALLAIEFRQFGGVLGVIRPNLGQLLVNCNGFNGKAILRVLISNSLEVICGLVVVAHARTEVPNRIQDRQVLGVFLDDLLVFRNRVGELPLLDKLLRLREDLYFVETKPECHKKSINPKSSLSKCRGKPRSSVIGAKVPQKNGETQDTWGNR